MRPERSLSASEIREGSLRQALLTYKQFFFARRVHSIASSFDLLHSGLAKKWSVLQWQGAQEVCHPIGIQIVHILIAMAIRCVKGNRLYFG